jgi:hypothetical protein
MKATLKTITPQIAREMLEKNTHNRQISKLHVDELVEEIKSGRWKINGDTICFCFLSSIYRNV